MTHFPPIPGARHDADWSRGLHAAAADREQELLLRLSAGHGTSASEWSHMLQRVDWDRVIQLAERHLVPYIGRELAQLSTTHPIPPGVIRTCSEFERIGAITYLRQWTGLRQVLGVLHARRIDAVALKGIALRHLVYAEPTLRPMTDLDLWIPSERVTEAADALIAAGWCTPPGGQDRDPRALDTRYVQRTDLKVGVELHAPPQSLAGLPSARLQLAWDRAPSVVLGGVRVRVLHPEDFLMHLALHAVKDRFGVGLRTLLDLRLVVDRWADDWQWQSMAVSCTENGIDVPMGLALGLARELVGAAVPDEFFGALPPSPHMAELRVLAARATIGAASGRLPGFAEVLALPVAAAGTARWRRIARRLTTHYFPHAFDPWRSPLRAIRDMARRAGYDVFVKLPKALPSWRQLVFRRAQIRQGIELARLRAQIGDLVADAQRNRTNAPR